MGIKNIESLMKNGILTDENKRRFEVMLENGGRIVGYFPISGIKIYACDIRCELDPDIKEFIMSNLTRGCYLRTSVCCEGKCEFTKGNRSALLLPNEGAAEYRTDDYPMSFPSDRFCGIITLIYVNRLPKDDSLYSILRDKLINTGFSAERTDSLFCFRLSNSTRREVDNVLRMCFSGEDSSLVLIKATELGLRYAEDIQNTKTEYRGLVSKSKLAIAEKIYTCLTEHFDESWTVKKFADRFNVSSTMIKKCFKSVYGYDVKEYLIKIRMEQAAEMLGKTNYPVGDIALRVGYATHTKFGAMFKEKFGVTPLEYRRSYRIAHIINPDNNQDYLL